MKPGRHKDGRSRVKHIKISLQLCLFLLVRIAKHSELTYFTSVNLYQRGIQIKWRIRFLMQSLMLSFSGRQLPRRDRDDGESRLDSFSEKSDKYLGRYQKTSSKAVISRVATTIHRSVLTATPVYRIERNRQTVPNIAQGVDETQFHEQGAGDRV